MTLTSLTVHHQNKLSFVILFTAPASNVTAQQTIFLGQGTIAPHRHQYSLKLHSKVSDAGELNKPVYRMEPRNPTNHP